MSRKVTTADSTKSPSEIIRRGDNFSLRIFSLWLEPQFFFEFEIIIGSERKKNTNRNF